MKAIENIADVAASTFARKRGHEYFWTKLFVDPVRKLQVAGISKDAKLTYFFLQSHLKQSDEPGYLVMNSHPISTKALAALLGKKEAVLSRELQELIEIGVLSQKTLSGNPTMFDPIMVRDQQASSYENDRKLDKEDPSKHVRTVEKSKVKESRAPFGSSNSTVCSKLIVGTTTDNGKPLVPGVSAVVSQTTEETESPSWLEGLRDVEAYKVFGNLREEWLKCVAHNAKAGKQVDRARFEGWLKLGVKHRDVAVNGKAAANNARDSKAAGESKGKKKLDRYDSNTFWDRYGDLLNDMPAIYAETEKEKMKLFKEWLCENIPVHWDKAAVDDVFGGISVYTIDACKEDSDQDEDWGWAGNNNVASDSRGITRRKLSPWLKRDKAIDSADSSASK